jgi:hypothetical protein
MSQLSRKCGSLDISKPYEPPQPVTGAAFVFFKPQATDLFHITYHLCRGFSQWAKQTWGLILWTVLLYLFHMRNNKERPNKRTECDVEFVLAFWSLPYWIQAIMCYLHVTGISGNRKRLTDHAYNRIFYYLHVFCRTLCSSTKKTNLQIARQVLNTI